MENTTVCRLTPTSGSFTDTYTGSLRGELSGAYQSELLRRIQNPQDPSQYFTKYSRFERLSPLTSTHGHLGYIQMTMVGSGQCLVSAEITTFFHSGGTQHPRAARMIARRSSTTVAHVCLGSRTSQARRTFRALYLGIL